MKSIRISLLSVVAAATLLTGCGTSGVGDILGGGNSRTDPYEQSLSDVRGTVDRVNTRDRYIVVEAEGYRNDLRNGGDEEIVLYYDESTRVQHEGNTYRPEDLEPGDRIVADIDREGSRLTVQDIEVLYDVTSTGTRDTRDRDTWDNRDDVRSSELRGTVRYIDTRDRTLEIEPSSRTTSYPTGRSGVVVVQYDSSTTVEFEGKRYRPENLERGDVVEVEVRETGGRLLAEEILVVDEAPSR